MFTVLWVVGITFNVFNTAFVIYPLEHLSYTTELKKNPLHQYQYII